MVVSFLVLFAKGSHHRGIKIDPSDTEIATSSQPSFLINEQPQEVFIEVMSSPEVVSPIKPKSNASSPKINPAKRNSPVANKNTAKSPTPRRTIKQRLAQQGTLQSGFIHLTNNVEAVQVKSPLRQVKKKSNSPNYKYHQVVRKKDDRKRLHATDCECCKDVSLFLVC